MNQKAFPIFTALILAVTAMSQPHYNSVTTIHPTVGSYTAYPTTGIRTVEYFDGLGRPWQTVLQGVSSNGKDLVTLKEYDGYGREYRDWLPVVSTGSNGTPLTVQTIQSQSLSTYGNDGKAYTLTAYEPSPRDVVTASTGPGEAWHSKGKKVSVDRIANTASGNLSCRRYATSDSRDVADVRIQTGREYYSAGTLSVERSTDEDGNVSLTFRDKLGQPLLDRRIVGTETLDTYYIYDIYGNLKAVLPPMASSQLTSAGTWTPNSGGSDVLSRYAYLYKYDTRNNMTGKKLPGAEWITYIYDRADRLLAVQDAPQREKNVCLITLHDNSGREVLTATGPMTYSIKGIGSSLAQTSFGITASGLPQTEGIGGSGYSVNVNIGTPAVTTIKYYDNYIFLELNAFKSSVIKKEDSYCQTPGGKLTCEVAVCPDTGKRLYTAYYYDAEGRVAKTVSTNLNGSYDVTLTEYTFTGKPKTKTVTHNGSAAATEIYTYVYDTADRLTKTTHKIGSQPAKTLVTYTYDKLGRTSAVNTAGSVQSSLSYNVRGWLTSMTSSLFTEELSYESGTGSLTPAVPSYGGNISAVQWKAPDATAARKYDFAYDELGRLTTATYGGGSYNTSYTYDKHGNILSLKRNGRLADGTYGQKDNLTYTYDGNRLTAITDAAEQTTITGDMTFADGTIPGASTEYAYDANGNITRNADKGIVSVEYDDRNMPKRITFTSGQTTEYTYSTDGRKWRVSYGFGSAPVTAPMLTVMDGGSELMAADNRQTVDYCGNVIYRNGQLERILIEDGYITYESGSYKYHYYIKDHLGNNRVVIDDNKAVEQVVHYYPFGAQFLDGQNTDKQPYKYNGKELDRMNGLDWYDYGARHYDASLGRWGTIDPLAEEYYNVSPYVYCMNNPVNKIDPDGMKIVDANGNILVSIINGNIHYSQYAHSDIKRIVNSMSMTKTGLGQLKKLIYSSTEIYIEMINESKIENKKITYGETIQGNYDKKSNYGKDFKNGKYILKEAKIIIYLGSIKEAIQSNSGLKYEGMTEDETLGVVMSHETVHSTNINEIDADVKYEVEHGRKARPNREDVTSEIERQVRKELKEKK